MEDEDLPQVIGPNDDAEMGQESGTRLYEEKNKRASSLGIRKQLSAS